MSLPSTDTAVAVLRAALAGAGVLAAASLGDFALSSACFGAVAWISVRRERTWRRAARRDPLTGVGNYRRLHERLHEAVSTDAQRFALLTLDVDCFKEINERHGHLEGDRLLREVSRALTDNVRGQDLVARQGGDEFSVLAPETDATGAALLAERIERALARIEAVERQPVRASIGIAVYPQDGRTPDDLLEKADVALRATKQRRRERLAA